MRRPSLPAVVTAAVAAAAGLFILLQMQPGLIVADTTAAGGDMGAHVWAPAYLRDHLLPHGRVTGWSPDWYAGFPALHFYFPLPSLAIVALDLVLPYGVAFKVVTVAGMVSLPAAAAVLGRSLRLPFPAPALMGAFTVLFVFDRFHKIWGGNAAATLAGEFAFSIGLSLALFFLAALARALETGRGRALAGSLLAATALCHLLPAAFAVAGAGVLVVLRRPDRARWALVAAVGALSLGLSAFWFLPFMVRMVGLSNDMGWEPTTRYLENLLPFLRHDPAEAPRAYTWHLWLVMPMAGLGVVSGLLRRRRGTMALAGLALVSVLAFRFLPSGPIWNARFLPFWYLCAYLLAAVALAEASLGLVGVSRRSRPRHSAEAPPAGLPGSRDGPVPPSGPARRRTSPVSVLAAVGGTVAVMVVAGLPLGVFSSGRLELPGRFGLPMPRLANHDTSYVPGWARWNFSGYERKPDYPEFRAVVDTMGRIGRERGCGRAMWEYESELNRFGTPMALMLLPYFTSGCVGSMEGLFFESSATVPYHFLNQSELSARPSRAMRDLPYRNLDVNAGVEHLQLMGVRYYLAISPEAQAQAAGHPDLTLVASTEPVSVSYTSGPQQRFWQVYEVRGSELVAPLAHEPVVLPTSSSTKHGWLEAAVDWYQDPARWDVPLASDGPPGWARVDGPSVEVPSRPVRQARVSNIRESDDRIVFDVDRPGTPVLVKASYFPNWKASGADGPWRVTPNLMVVVPTTTHVELHYGWTPVDLAGWALTAVALAAAVVLARARPARLPEPGGDEVWHPYRDPFYVGPPDDDRAQVLTGAARSP